MSARWLAHALLAAVSFAMIAACDAEGLGRPVPNFLIIGHHGAPNNAAENTIAGFQTAVELGANALEIDICTTGDDQWVVLHDDDPDSSIALARQLGGEGFLYVPFVPPTGSMWRRPVRELTLEELRAHYGYARLGGARDDAAVIPTLAEALAWMATENRVLSLYLDLKMASGNTELAAAFVDELALRYSDGSLDNLRTVILSTHRDIIDALSARLAAHPELHVRIAWDHEGPGALEHSYETGLRDLSMGIAPAITWTDLKAEIAEAVRAREEGRIDTVIAWTFDREMQLAELLAYSVDGIITNDPARLRSLWQESIR